jgi:hypothetical protein
LEKAERNKELIWQQDGVTNLEEVARRYGVGIEGLRLLRAQNLLIFLTPTLFEV